MTEQLAASSDLCHLISCAPVPCLIVCTKAVFVVREMFPKKTSHASTLDPKSYYCCGFYFGFLQAPHGCTVDEK